MVDTRLEHSGAPRAGQVEQLEVELRVLLGDACVGQQEDDDGEVGRIVEVGRGIRDVVGEIDLRVASGFMGALAAELSEGFEVEAGQVGPAPIDRAPRHPAALGDALHGDGRGAVLGHQLERGPEHELTGLLDARILPAGARW